MCCNDMRGSSIPPLEVDLGCHSKGVKKKVKFRGHRLVGKQFKGRSEIHLDGRIGGKDIDSIVSCSVLSRVLSIVLIKEAAIPSMIDCIPCKFCRTVASSQFPDIQELQISLHHLI
jgi:hypothetical protein